MAKKRYNSPEQQEFLSFKPEKREIPKMPEGYYSGDKPNPNLKAFVEEHIKEKPYNPETDDYNVPAFDKPIETTKATAIYNMHTYWSKKPHDAIRQYIRHYTKEGDLVLDPFCGSGGTALAALMEGRKAIAIDRSPAATFITKNYCTPVDVEELREAFEELKKKVKPEIDWLYETKCDRCGGRATTAYTVYSQVFRCPRCYEKVPLFDCVEAESKTLKGKAKKIKVCPYCYKSGFMEEISTRDEKFGAVPVLVSYICEGGCKPARDERRHNDEYEKKREYFKKYDLGKIKEIEGKEIPYWYPNDRMMNVPEEQERWGVKWRAGTSNFRTVDELFTKRNLWALAVIKKVASDFLYQDILYFTITGASLHCSKMATHKETGGGFMMGTYYLPQIYKERMVLETFTRKFNENTKGLNDISYMAKLNISTQSTVILNNLLNNSLDYIFTDPPYADKIQYGELNFVWEAWLGLDTHWHDEEIIVNEVRGKTEKDWENMMRQSMKECYRVLKPGRWLSLCYHDTSEGTWSLIQDIMAEAGFVADRSDSALFIDTGQKSYNQLTADKVTKRDLVINFRKPKPSEIYGSDFT
ncbi:MAG: DNA methyltransferase, partial [Candidatus Eremiobacterota bacterium]